MSFGDLKSRAGQQALNNFLESRSYIDGYAPSSIDNLVFEAMGVAPPGDLFHALRFFNHINSFSSAERTKFPASKKTLADFGASGAGKAAAAPAKKADDDFDLFDDDEDEDSEEKKRITEERLAAYAAKKSNKTAVIAKSSVLLDVKVWDDETDMGALEKAVRDISMDGLVWGSSKLVPVAFGVKKLQIQCVIEDDKVSTEALEEQICALEDFVQSVDIASFNKI